jgi:hypothetical protein
MADHADGGASLTRPPPLTLTALPPAVQSHVWTRLPVDVRLRCREVCVAWRDALDDAAMWTTLDLSPLSGVAHDVLQAMPSTVRRDETYLPVYDAGAAGRYAAEQRRTRFNLLLSAAAARARGQLRSVDVSECTDNASYCVSQSLLCDVLRDNAATLRELRILGGRPTARRMPRVACVDSDEALALMRAAPHLERFDADVACHARTACELLRRKPVRVRTLVLYSPDHNEDADMENVGAAARAHAGLAAIEFIGSTQYELPTKSALAPLLNALAQPEEDEQRATAPDRLRLLFRFCAFPDGALGALAHLLRSGRVADLAINTPQPEDEPAFGSLSAGVVALCGALRDCTSLTSLELSGCRMPHDVHTALLAAVTGHATLRRLHVDYNLDAAAMDVVGQRAAGAALAALLAANSPSLLELEVHDALSCREGLAPLCAALHGNAFLHRLSLLHDHVSVAFVANVLAPAAHACVSLRALESVSGNQLHHGMGAPEDKATRERRACVRGTIADVHAELAARAAQREHTQQQ